MGMVRPLCECGHTYAAHESLVAGRQSVCEYALAHDGHGCGCAEYDPAEPSTPVEMVGEVRNRLEMARVYAELLGTKPLLSVDWATLNRAILARWSLRGLAWIKRQAWFLAARAAA
jgi:hypothetical protein